MLLTFLGSLSQQALVGIIVVVTLFDPPLGHVGPIGNVTVGQLLLPFFLLISAMRFGARLGVPGRPPSRDEQAVRLIHGLVVFFVAVLFMNYVRSKYVLDDAVAFKQTFLGYFGAICTYGFVYSMLATRRVSFHPMFRVILVAAVVASCVGLAAVAFGLPLNLGSLRYSVRDYAAGAVRIGFLEAVGIAGLALVATRERRYWPVLGLLFSAAMVASGGRTASIGAIVALVAYLILLGRWRHLALVGGVGLLILLAFPQIGASPQAQRLSDVNGGTLVKNGRAFVYSESWEAFQRHPLSGTGVGVPFPVYANRQEYADFYRSTLQYGGHGSYTSLLKNFGLLGFLPFALAPLIALLALARRVRQNTAAGFFFILLTAQVVTAITGGNGSYPVYWFALAGATASLAVLRATNGEARATAA
jgi:hypothetical protein